MAVKNYGVSVREKLKNYQTDKVTYQQVLIRYLHERLLYRLSVSRFNQRFFLKGGALMFAHERFAARPTVDIDFMGDRISNDMENIQNTFKEICAIEYPEDGVTFDTDKITVSEITPDREYQGVQLHITAHLDTIVQNLSMDIGFGDIVIPHPVKLDYPALLEGMDDIPVMAYSLETVVAEKFQTMIARTVLNSRMKDFYDVYTIFNHNDLDEDNLKLAVTEVMANRDTHYEENHPLFTEEFGKDLSRNTQWAAFIKKNKIDDAPSFPEVLSFICDRMKPVWESLA